MALIWEDIEAGGVTNAAEQIAAGVMDAGHRMGWPPRREGRPRINRYYREDNT
jgi:hypothetical protein